MRPSWTTTLLPAPAWVRVKTPVQRRSWRAWTRRGKSCSARLPWVFMRRSALLPFRPADPRARPRCGRARRQRDDHVPRKSNPRHPSGPGPAPAPSPLRMRNPPAGISSRPPCTTTGTIRLPASMPITKPPFLKVPELARARARPLGEDEEAGARAQRLGGPRERLAGLDAIAAVDGDEPGPAQHGPEKWPREDLLLDHGLEVGAERLEEHGRVEMAHVVRDEDGVPGVPEVLAALQDDACTRPGRARGARPRDPGDTAGRRIP